MNRWLQRLEWPVYIGVAMLAVCRGLPAGRAVGDGVDLSGTLWHYGWLAHCLVTGQDPRVTDLMYHPVGKDLFAANGSNLVDAVAALPFVVLIGPIDGQAWFVALLLFLNAVTFRPLARHLLGSSVAVVAATLAWELNPYVLFELADGRPTQALLWFLPLAILAFLRLLEDDGTRRHALLAGVFTAAQAWTYWFMGWFMAPVLGWLAVHGLWRSRSRLPVLGRLGLAAGTCLALVAPAALAMARVGNPSGALGSGDAFQFPAKYAGTFPILGPGPLTVDLPAVLLVVGLWLFLGPGRTRWLPVLLGAVVMAIGPRLGVGPHWPTLDMWPYQAAIAWLPFYERLWFPYRWMCMAMLPAALATGFVVQRIGGWWRRWEGPVALALTVLLGLSLSWASLLPLPTSHVAPPAVASWMGEQASGAVIHLPFGLNQRRLIWQLVAPLPAMGGLGEDATHQWPPGFEDHLDARNIDALLVAVRQPGRAPEWEAGYRAQFLDQGYRWVVLHRERVEFDHRRLPEPPQGWTVEALAHATRAITTQVTDILGPPTAVEGPAVVWDLQGLAEAPQDLVVTAERLAERSWGPEPRAPHLAFLEGLNREQALRIPGWKTRRNREVRGRWMRQQEGRGEQSPGSPVRR